MCNQRLPRPALSSPKLEAKALATSGKHVHEIPPTLYSKTGVCRGMPIFLIFALNIECGYSLEKKNLLKIFRFKKSLYIACACFRNDKSDVGVQNPVKYERRVEQMTFRMNILAYVLLLLLLLLSLLLLYNLIVNFYFCAVDV